MVSMDNAFPPKDLVSRSRYHGPDSRVEMYERNINRDGIGRYYLQECEFLRPFFTAVKNYAKPAGRILEAGYGPGVTSTYLSRDSYDVLCIDEDPAVVELGRSVNRRLGGTARFQVCGLFEIEAVFGTNSFDAVISDVTLEHFDDNDIIEALRKQLSVAPVNIFAVHCANLLPQFFSGLDGGERLLNPSQWDDLIRRAGGRTIDKFGYGFYYTRIGQWAQFNWRVPVIAERIFNRQIARIASAVTGFVVVAS